MQTIKLSIIAAVLATLSAMAFAQAPYTTPGVDNRQANQTLRIQQGRATGELAPFEARRLMREQQLIRRAEADAKADGRVTVAERRRLNRMLDEADRNISRQKRDVNTALPGPGR